MTDARLIHTADGGEIEFVNGVLTLDDGLLTAAYLSLFGGNTADSGLAADDRRQWWGNLTEPDPRRRYRSETQYLLRSIPATPNNLKRVQAAAERDLAWMLELIASTVSVRVTIPGVNRVRIAGNIVVDDSPYQFAFSNEWRAVP
jgi:phage gp46-like protein